MNIDVSTSPAKGKERNGKEASRDQLGVVVPWCGDAKRPDVVQRSLSRGLSRRWRAVQEAAYYHGHRRYQRPGVRQCRRWLVQERACGWPTLQWRTQHRV